LIFKDDSHIYTAKLTDFGYSTCFASEDNQIVMPASRYFVAPEWHHRNFTTSPANARRMDSYSFGILCFWLLFYNTERRSDRDFRNDLNQGIPVSILAYDLVAASENLDDERRGDLIQFFDLTLAEDPASRGSDFRQLLHLLTPQR
jgi:serine/threonine protein kinase